MMQQDSNHNSQPHSSVVIVGAGIIGLACAHYLTEKNISVTVLDQGLIAQGCSYGNCGYICPSHIMPLAGPGMIMKGLKSMLTPRSAFRIKPQWRMKFYAWLMQFTRHCSHRHMLDSSKHLLSILDLSRTCFDQLFADHAISCDWQERGLMYAFKSEEGLAAFKKTDEFLSQTYQVAARFLNPQELAEFEPALVSGLAGAYLYEGDAHLDPYALAINWAELLTQQGVNFIENCQVQQINKSSQGIQSLNTSQGEIKADKYILATGAWSPKMASQLGLNIPIEPGKGYSVTIPKSEYQPRTPMLFPENNIGLTPFKDSFRVGSMMEFVGYDTTVAEHRIEYLFNSANTFLQEPLNQAHQQSWYGWRPMTWDSLPIISHLPQLNNAILATGHNMLGLTLAPATGKLVAELVTEAATSIDVRPYAVDRFN